MIILVEQRIGPHVVRISRRSRTKGDFVVTRHSAGSLRVQQSTPWQLRAAQIMARELRFAHRQLQPRQAKFLGRVGKALQFRFSATWYRHEEVCTLGKLPRGLRPGDQVELVWDYVGECWRFSKKI